MKRLRISRACKLGNSGFTLAEVMIALGVSAIGMTGMMAFMEMQSKQMRGVRAVGNRDSLKWTLESALRSASVINASAGYTKTSVGYFPTNDKFYKCRYGGGCTSHNSNPLTKNPVLIPQALVLTAQNGVDVLSGSGLPPAGNLISLTNKYAVYDSNGARCSEGSQASTQCPIRTYTWFKAKCPNNTPTCDRAESFLFNFRIEQDPNVQIDTAGRLAPQTMANDVPWTFKDLESGADFSGEGTANKIPRWTDAKSLGDSMITQNASAKFIGIGEPSPTRALQLNVSGVPNVLQVGDAMSAQMSGDDSGNAVFGSNLYVDQMGALRTAGDNPNSYGFAGVHATWGKLKFYAASGNTIGDVDVTPPALMTINKYGVGINDAVSSGDPTLKLVVNGKSIFKGGLVDMQSQLAVTDIATFSGVANFNNSVTVSGSLTVNGTTGNVLHGCKTYSNRDSSHDRVTVQCPANMIATGGGGRCNDYAYDDLRLSHPTPDGNNTTPTGWHALCNDEDVTAWVICCYH